MHPARLSRVYRRFETLILNDKIDIWTIFFDIMGPIGSGRGNGVFRDKMQGTFCRDNFCRV